ncbi:MAG: CbtA family protein [Burkholderiales bacterium]
MLFRRLVLFALAAGVVLGALLSAIQSWRVVPIISAAEVFERARAAELSATAHAGHEQDSGQHVHAAAEWEPTEGAERIGLTVLSDILAAIGYALVLLAIMAFAHRKGLATRFDWRYGLLWGLAGYAVVYVAPGLGLSPEIPGAADEAAAAASLTARQSWWIFSAICTAVALGTAAFAKARWRWVAALGLLAVPYLVGAPETAGVAFAGYPPEAVAELSKLAREFIWATAFANLLFWLGLGSASGWGMQRFLMKETVN